MADKFYVTLRIEPVLHRYVGGATGKSPGEGVAVNVPDAQGSHLHVEGHGDGLNMVRQLHIDVDAESETEARDHAFQVARRFVAMEALAEDARVVIDPTLVVVRSDPARLHSRDAMTAVLFHVSGAQVQSAWEQLASMTDQLERSRLGLAIDLLYLGSIAPDSRTAFLTYWSAFELLLRPEQRPQPAPVWITNAEKELAQAGISVHVAELDGIRIARNALVHPSASLADDDLEQPPERRLREILAAWINHKLAISSESHPQQDAPQ